MNAKICLVVFLSVVAGIRSQAMRFPSIGGGQQCCGGNQIAVDGCATVEVSPDIATISLTLKEEAATSAEAVQKINEKVARATTILTAQQIPQEDYKTRNLNVFPKRSYTNGRSQIVGHTASQTFQVIVQLKNLEGQNLAQLIDRLVLIDGISLGYLRFDRKDKSEAQTQARKKAFEDARQKAAEYSEAADAILGRVIKVQDGVRSENAPVAKLEMASFRAADISSAPTTISVGDLQVNYCIDVSFMLLARNLF